MSVGSALSLQVHIKYNEKAQKYFSSCNQQQVFLTSATLCGVQGECMKCWFAFLTDSCAHYKFSAAIYTYMYMYKESKRKMSFLFQ